MVGRAVFLLAAALSGGLPAGAQVLTGRIVGAVTDESRAVLPGVTITIASPALPGGPMSIVTNAQGSYQLVELPVGVYELTATLQGFASLKETDLRVTAGGTVEVPVVLKVAAVAETVTVTGGAAVVDTRQTGISQSLPAATVEAIGTQRNGAQDYMAMLPGISPSGGGYEQTSSMNVMGSNSNETSYMFDGIKSNMVIGGAGYGYFDIDAVEELNVVTLGASAEYQQAQGGVLNVIGKSGTNNWRGDGAVYWAPAGLTSQPFTKPCPMCPANQPQTGFTLYKYQDYSFHLGGPVLKNKLWFFSGMTSAGPSYRNPGQPDQPAKFQWVRYDARSNSKVTWQINDRMKVNETFYFEWWGWTSPMFPTFTNPVETIEWYAGDEVDSSTELTWTLKPNSLLSARYTIHTLPYGDIGFGPNDGHDSSSLNTPGHYDQLTGVSTLNYTGGPADAYQPRSDEVDLKLNQYISGARASQNVRVGFQFRRDRVYAQNVYPGGVLYEDNNGKPDQLLSQAPSYYAAQSNNWGIWAEDELHLNRLTIVPAARFDHMVAISPAAPQVDPTVSVGNGGLCHCVETFPFTGTSVAGLGTMFTWNYVSPRVGMNLKLTDDNRTVLRGTYGRYYRPIILNDFTGVHPGIAPTILTRYNPATGGYTTPISIVTPQANIRVDPNIKDLYTDQYSIGVDRELVKNLAISVSYVHKSSKDEIGWVDIGGVYGTQTVTTPIGTSLTVSPLLNSPNQRLFQRTNPPGFGVTYNGLVTGLTRRLADRWTANFGYTYSRTQGLQVTPGNAITASTVGQDPNDYVNLTGRVTFDRPHVFTALGTYVIPRAEMNLSASLQLASGIPYGAQMQVPLPQGRLNVYFQPPGTYRVPFQDWLLFRASKMVIHRGSRQVELVAEVRNALQNISVESITSRIYTSPNFGVPNSWAIPRQLMFRVRGTF
jgi:hypothetical protein